ncbi:Uncharacterised protein [Burkholderia pseudomallei]|nr:Uncharacterised protein [Burkholderia pseudomallei]CAJ3281291.1 Uncharacterised protein [Burkholderia pseudomallei]CAJ3353309.1 Uncharacterised protein [Burkholderia pseudomallei]CAJ3401047.1 Uncharacterised protein [Burkholderia pseudomallei]CAJ3413091.1 Uncharacterised protein [Burkholderia pseudomallei]
MGRYRTPKYPEKYPAQSGILRLLVEVHESSDGQQTLVRLGFAAFLEGRGKRVMAEAVSVDKSNTFVYIRGIFIALSFYFQWFVAQLVLVCLGSLHIIKSIRCG